MPSLDDKVKEFGIRWKDLTSLGLPTSGLGEQLLSNEQLYEMDPDRLNFYLQFLSAITGSNPDIVKKVLAKENLTRHQREQMNDSMRKVYKYFHKQKADHDKLMRTTTDKKTDANGASYLELKDIYTSDNYPTITDIDQILKVEQITNLNKDPKINALKGKLPFIQSLNLTDQDNLKVLKDALETFKKQKQDLMTYRNEMDRINEGLKGNILTANSTIQPAVSMEELRKVQGGGESIEGGATYKDFRKLYDAEKDPELKIKDGYDADTDNFDKKDPKSTDFKVVNEVTGRKALPTEKVTKPVVDAYMTSASFSPEVEKVTMGDRIVFILATYIIRGIALFLLEWGVYTNFIDSFNKAFAFYFGIYACIFLLLYILVNARQDDYVFRMLFFYINTQSENNKGVLRIIVHLLSILMLFPIPFIVKEFREFKKEGVLTFSEKRTIVNAVGRFTLFIWIFTSIIALRF
uniref:Uncharacterized protein n=1 Tax=viral metagenome TaxID=1070528 RepID=A0A6C0CRA5_9ZZZZ